MSSKHRHPKCHSHPVAEEQTRGPHKAGPLETFANAGGVHLARALLAEFAENVAKLVAEQTREATAAPRPDPLSAGGENEGSAPRQESEKSIAAAGPELSGRKILWRALISWLRQVFFGKREAQ